VETKLAPPKNVVVLTSILAHNVAGPEVTLLIVWKRVKKANHVKVKNHDDEIMIN
jgi:hypothetical protein